MESFEILLEYVNRQVVRNVYREDELLERDGYSFDRMSLQPDRLLFMKENRIILELPAGPTAKLVRLSGFPRYYAIEHEDKRTELYFP